MRYKIAGVADYLMGGVQILVGLTLIFIVIPKLRGLYLEFSADVPLVKSYLAPLTNILFGSFGIFLGHKIFSLKDKARDKYFTISIIYLAATFIAAGILTQLSVLSVMAPLYDLTSNLN